MMQQQQVAETLQDVIDDFLEETGASLTEAGVELASMGATVAVESAVLVGLPGYARAVKAKLRTRFAKGLLRGVQEADELDERLWRTLYGAIAVAARAVAGA